MSWYKASQHIENYNFAAGEEKAKRMSDAEINYALKDLKETIQIQEADREGYHPKLGYYWDELHTLLKEKKDREEKRARGKNLNELV